MKTKPIEDANLHPRPTAVVGMSKSEIANYSIINVIRALWANREHGWSFDKVAGFETEISGQIDQQLGSMARGIRVPSDVLQHWGSQFRAPPADTTENASLVPEDHLADEWVRALQNASTVMAAGARPIRNLVGDVSIPKTSSAVVTEWLNEDENAADQDLVTESIQFTPTTLASSLPITRRLLKQSSPDVEALVREEISASMGTALDAAALNGSGAGAIPLGVFNRPIQTVSVSDAGNVPDWGETISFESTLDGLNTLTAGASWIAHPTVRSGMRSASTDPGSGIFIWGNDGRAAGYTARSSNNMPAAGLLFGNFADLLIAFWGALDMTTDRFTKAASGGAVVRAFLDCQIHTRRDESFAKAV